MSLKMARRRPSPGDVVEIPLPLGGAAYGRVLRDASIAIYRPGSPESLIGSRDFQFVVGIDDKELRALDVVAHDPSVDDEDEWPPPYCVTDPITGAKRIYYRGEITSAVATPEACEGLEPAAVWHLTHIVDRITSNLA